MVNEKIKFSLFWTLFLGLILIHSEKTSADLTAQRIVKNNQFQATTLALSLRNSANFTHQNNLFSTTGIIPNGFDVAAFWIKKEGQMKFKYLIKTKTVAGDEKFCRALKLQFIKNWQIEEQGSLDQINIIKSLTNTEQESWFVFLSLENDQNSIKNKNCHFEVVIRAFRQNPESTKGFWAEKKLTNIITSGNW